MKHIYCVHCCSVVVYRFAKQQNILSLRPGGDTNHLSFASIGAAGIKNLPNQIFGAIRGHELRSQKPA